MICFAGGLWIPVVFRYSGFPRKLSIFCRYLVILDLCTHIHTRVNRLWPIEILTVYTCGHHNIYNMLVYTCNVECTLHLLDFVRSTWFSRRGRKSSWQRDNKLQLQHACSHQVYSSVLRLSLHLVAHSTLHKMSAFWLTTTFEDLSLKTIILSEQVCMRRIVAK